MERKKLVTRYQELQRYVGWNDEYAQHVHSVAPLLRPYFKDLVADFYAEIEQHPGARKVITGGDAQIERLKGTLIQWLEDFFSGCYDADYVTRRWRVGLRHVEIGLDQVYTNAALARLRNGLLVALLAAWHGDQRQLDDVRLAILKLLDLDLAIIEDAYQTEFNRRQQRTERLATIGKIAGGIAHELRNPLNVVRTSVYYLLNAKSPSPEKARMHLERIDRQVLVADNVITALNDFAKLPMPDPRPLAVAPSLKEALELNPLPPEIQVAFDCPPTVPAMLGDAHQLRIVFGNLIRNARDAMPDGGLLSITARPVDSSVEIAFADTGTGISAADLGRIMEPLFSTKSRGIGLGLPIARAILEKHNGTLSVSSELGRGTTMTVCLVATGDSPTP
jgi:signal transduction histidine kinase